MRSISVSECLRKKALPACLQASWQAALFRRILADCRHTSDDSDRSTSAVNYRPLIRSFKVEIRSQICQELATFPRPFSRKPKESAASILKDWNLVHPLPTIATPANYSPHVWIEFPHSADTIEEQPASKLAGKPSCRRMLAIADGSTRRTEGTKAKAKPSRVCGILAADNCKPACKPVCKLHSCEARTWSRTIYRCPRSLGLADQE